MVICKVGELPHGVLQTQLCISYVCFPPDKCKGKEERGSEVMRHLDRLLAKRNHTSEAGRSFLCVWEILCVQFVNGHSTVDKFSFFQRF